MRFIGFRWWFFIERKGTRQFRSAIPWCSSNDEASEKEKFYAMLQFRRDIIEPNGSCRTFLRWSMTMTEGDVTSLRNPRSVHVATRDSTKRVSTLLKSMLRKGKLRTLVILYVNEFQLRVSRTRGIDPVVSIHPEKPVGLICRLYRRKSRSIVRDAYKNQ